MLKVATVMASFSMAIARCYAIRDTHHRGGPKEVARVVRRCHMKRGPTFGEDPLMANLRSLQEFDWDESSCWALHCQSDGLIFKVHMHIYICRNLALRYTESLHQTIHFPNFGGRLRRIVHFMVSTGLCCEKVTCISKSSANLPLLAFQTPQIRSTEIHAAVTVTCMTIEYDLPECQRFTRARSKASGVQAPNHDSAVIMSCSPVTAHLLVVEVSRPMLSIVTAK